jgi:glyoxylase-like metal-dependent hydrolase (beta-lactamase superfamily II)
MISADGPIRVGDAEVTRIVEWAGPLRAVGELFPDTPAQVWRANESWLAPAHYQPEQQIYRAAIQTWVIRTGGTVILVDTGVGNDRARPQIPVFDHLDTDFLDRLATAGVAPGDVDVVINTHIHYDHVGWNTRRRGGDWAPTFPNATYLVPAADYDYFHPDHAERMRPATTDDERRRFAGIKLVFTDSIAPVEAAGQLVTWSQSHRVAEGVELVPAPGHTPGSSVVWLQRDGASAVFVGDLMHTPVQVLRPDDRCSFDVDPAVARASRRAVLARAAQLGALVLPAHFAGRGGVTLTADGTGFAVAQWAGLAEL